MPRRTIYKIGVRTLEAKLGKNQRPEERGLVTLFFGTRRNKAYPSKSDISVTYLQGKHAGYGGVITTAASAQLVDQH